MHAQQLIQENIGCCETMLEEENGGGALDRIIGLADGEHRLIDRYTSKFILEHFDRSKLESLEEIFKDPHVKMDSCQFVRFFLNAIDHAEHETLYLTMALLDTFRELTQHRVGAELVTLFDLTNYFCQHIINEDCSVKLELHELPSEKMNLPDLTRVRQIDKQAPLVHEKAEINLPKIAKGNCKTDKTSHKSGPVEMIIYSQETNRLLTLDTLSTSIKIFDTSLNFKRELAPTQAKSSKQLAILSLAYSKKQQRIGCIIKDLGMSFWEFGDGLATEKKILKNCGERMYFFELFEEWVTTAGSSTHFWSIKEESIKYTIEGDARSHINSVCEVPVLRLVCVAYSSDKKKHMHLRKLVLYRGKSVVSQLQLGRAGCHTVHFNNAAQVLIPIGYRISIPVYTVHPEYFDFTQVADLVGHSSLVTCVSDIGASSLVCTGDDVGYIRIWDLRMMRCVQVIKAARWLSHLLYLPEGRLIFTDSRVNMMNFQGVSSHPEEGDSLQLVSVHYDSHSKAVLAATRRDVRVYDANTGRITDIYRVVAGEEVSSFTLGVGRKFLVGTDRGTVKFFNKNGELTNSFQGHGNEVLKIRADWLNQLVLTSSWDGDIKAWREPTKGEFERKHREDSALRPVEDKEPYRLVKSISKSKANTHMEITSMELNLYHSLVVTTSPEQAVYVWDYEYCKLMARIELASEPTFTYLTDEYPLLLVGSKDGRVWLFEFHRKEFKLHIQLLSYFAVEKNSDTEGDTAEFMTEFPRSKGTEKVLPGSNGSRPQQGRLHTPERILVEVHDSKAMAYLAFASGLLGKFALMPLTGKAEDVTKKQNYNPHRHCQERFEDELLKNQFESVNCLQAMKHLKERNKPAQEWLHPTHRDSILSLEMLQSQHLLTSSLDGCFKVSAALTGETICAYNINVPALVIQHPLPLKWELRLQFEEEVRERVGKSLRTLAAIFRKYEQDISLSEIKRMSVLPLLTRVSEGQPHPVKPSKTAPILLCEEYTPADINPHYPKPDHRPTLKELQAYKRVYLSNANKGLEGTSPTAQSTLCYDSKEEERDSLTEFLNPSTLGRLTWKGIDRTEREQNDAAYIKSLVATFEGNRLKTDENELISCKRGKSKERADLMSHARMKSYLSGSGQPSVASILTSINSKIEQARRKHNRLSSRIFDGEPLQMGKKLSHSIMEGLPR